ncbi:DNA methyltransferase [Paracoccus jeotgali]|uniref:DNA methyltransferase n=1 Tax=Paracoccus jeotgali TaxID=2065379 RepID=UPI0028B025A8|nr:DNA methyltransferase [Paracoccus jeotgali]
MSEESMRYANEPADAFTPEVGVSASAETGYFLVRKHSLESADDQYLAWREVRDLTGISPKEVTLEEASAACGVDLRKFDVPRFGIFYINWSGDIEILVTRLAFWDLVVDVRSAASPVRKVQSAAFEDTVFVQNPTAVLSEPTFQLSPATRRKNSYLTHNFHKYKAKFFPRLARSLINMTANDQNAVVLDPFCGSGTTNVEAGLMGYRSIGVDLDPLSVFISRTKASISEISDQNAEGNIRELVKRYSQSEGLPLFSGTSRVASRFEMPKFLSVRKPKRLPEDAITAIEEEVNRVLSQIDEVEDEFLVTLSKLALSHAISTKISLRWMGTGDDRFALEIGKRTITSVMLSQLKMYAEKARSATLIREQGGFNSFVDPQFQVGSALRLPLGDCSVDSIVTSPPYLPAASGRETYLRSRAASLVALGLMTEDEVLAAEHDIMGSVLATGTAATSTVPPMVLELTDWMLPQRARSPKALPTIAYFENLRRSLVEMNRVLKPGGKGAMVVSKEHVFWELVSRKIVRRFNMAAAVSEIIEGEKYGVGMRVDEVINLELPKMDFAARPGAKHAYAESIIIFQKL